MRTNRIKPLLALIFVFAVVLSGCRSSFEAKTSKQSKPSKSAASSFVSASSGTNAAISSETTGSAASSSEKTNTLPSDSRAHSGETSETNLKEKYVVLTIDASKANDGIVANNVKVEYNAGDTVYTILKRYCDEKGIKYKIKKSSGAYVSMIDGVEEFNFGAGSGWLYSVDGKFLSLSCDKAPVKQGSIVRWVYTTDLGKSEGATP